MGSIKLLSKQEEDDALSELSRMRTLIILAFLLSVTLASPIKEDGKDRRGPGRYQNLDYGGPCDHKTERDDHKCGPDYGGCGCNRFCSTPNWHYECGQGFKKHKGTQICGYTGDPNGWCHDIGYGGSGGPQLF